MLPIASEKHYSTASLILLSTFCAAGAALIVPEYAQKAYQGIYDVVSAYPSYLNNVSNSVKTAKNLSESFYTAAFGLFLPHAVAASLLLKKMRSKTGIALTFAAAVLGVSYHKPDMLVEGADLVLKGVNWYSKYMADVKEEAFSAAIKSKDVSRAIYNGIYGAVAPHLPAIALTALAARYKRLILLFGVSSTLAATVALIKFNETLPGFGPHFGRLVAAAGLAYIAHSALAVAYGTANVALSAPSAVKAMVSSSRKKTTDLNI